MSITYQELITKLTSRSKTAVEIALGATSIYTYLFSKPLVEGSIHQDKDATYLLINPVTGLSYNVRTWFSQLGLGDKILRIGYYDDYKIMRENVEASTWRPGGGILYMNGRIYKSETSSPLLAFQKDTTQQCLYSFLSSGYDSVERGTLKSFGNKLTIHCPLTVMDEVKHA